MYFICIGHQFTDSNIITDSASRTSILVNSFETNELQPEKSAAVNILAIVNVHYQKLTIGLNSSGSQQLNPYYKTTLFENAYSRGFQFS